MCHGATGRHLLTSDIFLFCYLVVSTNQWPIMLGRNLLNDVGELRLDIWKACVMSLPPPVELFGCPCIGKKANSII